MTKSRPKTFSPGQPVAFYPVADKRMGVAPATSWRVAFYVGPASGMPGWHRVKHGAFGEVSLVPTMRLREFIGPVRQ